MRAKSSHAPMTIPAIDGAAEGLADTEGAEDGLTDSEGAGDGAADLEGVEEGVLDGALEGDELG